MITTQAVSKIWLTLPGKPMDPAGASQIKSQTHTVKDLWLMPIRMSNF